MKNVLSEVLSAECVKLHFYLMSLYFSSTCSKTVFEIHLKISHFDVHLSNISNIADLSNDYNFRAKYCQDSTCSVNVDIWRENSSSAAKNKTITRFALCNVVK